MDKAKELIEEKKNPSKLKPSWYKITPLQKLLDCQDTYWDPAWPLDPAWVIITWARGTDIRAQAQWDL